VNLQSLGADAHVQSAFQMYAAQCLVLARVAISHGDRYRLFTEAGEIAGEPAGVLWHRGSDAAGMPVVGDWVAARIAGPDYAIVEAVLPRRSCFERHAAGQREDRQAIAANIDLVFLVCGLDGDFNLRRLERYLILAAESRVAPVIVLNKADLCSDAAARQRDVAAVAGAAAVVAVSALAESGVDPLYAFLGPGRTVALLGSSGVGKSTIVNRLLGGEHFRTGAVRESDSRGRHTTTHRELAPLPGGGALIDTPGMRELQLWAGQGSVDEVFDEITALAAQCRFGDCTHAVEPGCAVQAALAEGTVSQERWESYRKLLGEARRHEALADAQVAQERKRKVKETMKAARRFYKSRR
jgi:ribosome biogenesis GTPase / thiamine phosphate phosphatase